MRTIKLLLSAFLAVFLGITLSCSQKDELKRGEGFIDVKGGKVWYRVVGTGNKTPILNLHGGPGGTSYILNPTAALGKDRPVIFFDQLGSGRSDHITDTSLMTIENYVEQVEQLRKSLGLKEFYLMGHSWGTMLGLEYYLKYPEGIKGILFCGACISIPLYFKGVDSLLTRLPDSVRNTVISAERDHNFDTPEYQYANKVWTDSFVARSKIRRPDRDSGAAAFGHAVYEYMWGPTEFTATGTLKDYDRTDMLPGIKVPVIFIVGEYDEVLPSGVRYYHSLVPGSKFALIPNSGHLTTQDNPEEFNKVVSDFLNEIEN